jgi:hypothetical protein
MSRSRERLSLPLARRVVLAAQGFAEPRPRGAVTAAHVKRVIDRIGLLQIDSVNVLVRSHYLPLFSRLGPYAHDLLDRLAYRRRHLFEYWGHEASLLPAGTQPLWRWRMREARAGAGVYGELHRFAETNRGYVERVLAEIRERGPLGASELSEAGKSTGSWWGWSEGKKAVEWLFWTGDLTTAERRNFERVYDLPERVLPAHVIAAPTPSREEAQRALMLQAIRSLGIATERCLRDYFRLGVEDTKARLAELADAGLILPVAVDGLERITFLDPDARFPRHIEACALLSPFDSLVFDRERTEALFGFRYRIELYTPQPKRQYGYYVLPFLLGERIAARVDLKADRAGSRLLVHGAFAEAGEEPGAIAPALAEELRLMAQWLGLGEVAVGDRGDLAARLRRQRLLA